VADEKTFKHSGDLGDIVFGLPAVRALGGGILYLDPAGGEAEPLVQAADLPKNRTHLTPKAIEAIKPLLLLQPYIKDVRLWAGETVDYNLDEFRSHLKYKNLSDSHLTAFGLPMSERDRAWIEVDDPIVYPQYPIIIARNVRNTPNYAFWAGTIQEIKHQCAFVGYPKEHEIFEYVVEEKVPYLYTPDILMLARVIAGCRQFVGNQSLPHALAEAMKKRLIVEMCRIAPQVLFVRDGATYV
jgi:hypothetical protein